MTDSTRVSCPWCVQPAEVLFNRIDCSGLGCSNYSAAFADRLAAEAAARFEEGNDRRWAEDRERLNGHDPEPY